MTTAREAAARILDSVTAGPALRIPLEEALGLVLAESVDSPINVPYHRNSAMDGYAARADDVRGSRQEAPVTLTVVQRIAAGGWSDQPVGPGECVRIFTGAPVPPGADSVIRQEDTDLGAAQVRILRDRDAGSNVRQAGEDIRAGQRLLDAGVSLGPAQLGLLASVAVSHPLVHRRPRVAILATGDEIVDVDHPDAILSGRKIGSSNTHTLRALIREAGGEVVNLGISPDDPEQLRARLARSVDTDLLITSAGVSVGEHDHLRTVIQAMGGTIHFWRTKIRPGAPIVFGSLGAIPWLGLPGNPVSTMVTFELFARPAIRRLAGHSQPFRRVVRCRMAEAIKVVPTLQHFLRVRLEHQPQGLVARLTGSQSSGILTSMATADALAIVPTGSEAIAAGTLLDALVLNDPLHQVDPPF